MAYPLRPSCANMRRNPAQVEVANGSATEVCILTFNASSGQSATSAINSAEAEASQIQAGAIGVRQLRASPTRILVLEVLVEAELACTLKGVANRGGEDTFPDARKSLSTRDGHPSIEDGSVEAWIDLEIGIADVHT